MCLIIYSPAGAPIDRDVFDLAHSDNPDGIGIMSPVAVEKFVGRKSGRKAWRLLSRLAAERVPFAIHFRWRTHGPVNRALAHPFRAPDGDNYIMHNGVISWTAAYAREDESDTSVFVRDLVNFALAPDRQKELDDLADFIGRYNKLCILDMKTGRFDLCNEDSGEWVNGLWYSNTHSMPDRLMPRKFTWGAASPSRFLDAQVWGASADTEADKVLTLDWPELPGDKIAQPVDNEDSYYRGLAQSAGYYDVGAGYDDAEDYRAALRALAVYSRVQ